MSCAVKAVLNPEAWTFPNATWASAMSVEEETEWASRPSKNHLRYGQKTIVGLSQLCRRNVQVLARGDTYPSFSMRSVVLLQIVAERFQGIVIRGAGAGGEDGSVRGDNIDAVAVH